MRHKASALLREHEWSKGFVEAQLAHKEAGLPASATKRHTFANAGK